ncbi:U-box domain-containing protein 5-like isoform X2 [Olea europaea var. sylvestris]|uniref:U-box domain-containing protein 5-like isoform X2 n=1 Tax=Olea europaea var. sylvestris TaxID=158386 RepID=UPI000C1D537E|nr:U-box domain-containing protein 5-like isoform X2 [Olea europaea var. sylvestris]
MNKLVILCFMFSHCSLPCWDCFFLMGNDVAEDLESLPSPLSIKALTGDAILSRCKKSTYLMEQSLSQIQKMVPITLASEISGIIFDLRSSTFYLDPSEEEAGKVLWELLHGYGSKTDTKEEDTLGSVRVVSLKLHITSQKALLIEKRSIKKLLDKFGKSDSCKRKILLFFLNLLNKYGNIIMKEKTDNSVVRHEDTVPSASSYDLSTEVERTKYMPDESQIDMLSSPIPPKEFICPLSMRLMYDPVVIASGQTFERVWIQRWFDEGQDTCPNTKVKLGHLTLTSNTGIKDIISKWCTAHGVSIPNPAMQAELVKSFVTSTNSIASLSCSLNDLYLPLDFHVSSDVLHSEITSAVNLLPMKKDNDSQRFQASASTQEMNMEFFAKISSLPWDSQCTMVEDVKRFLIGNDEACTMMSFGNFFQPLLRFMKDAHDIRDVEAQMTGCQLLLEFVQKCRKNISCIDEDACSLLGSYLDTEVGQQALAILEVLSLDQHSGYKIAASGALIGILNIVDTQIEELLEPALHILSNLLANSDIGSFLVPPAFVPKLVPLFENNTLARYCVTILKYLCDEEDARVSVAETDGCISSISKLLENESHEDQERAVEILLSLCSERVQYCQLVMAEGVIPGLVNVRANGNKKAKAMATELLRILKEEFNTDGEYSGSDVGMECKVQNPPSKAPGIFSKIFSKRNPLTAKKEKKKEF